METAKPAPDVADFVYGANWRNTFDLWKPAGELDKPWPLFVWFHQNGFVAGDKSLIPAELIEALLGAGIAVASANYRFSQQAPCPAMFHDCGRAIQMLRYFAPVWNLDPSRVAAGGCSAGGGAALWLAYHADLADPASRDPVARLSTRLSCTCNTAAHCSYDPHFIRAHIPGPAWTHEVIPLLFQVPTEEFDAPWARETFKLGSPIEFVDERAVPTLMFHERPDVPADRAMTVNESIHHGRFAQVLAERLKKFGVECEIRYRSEYPNPEAGESALFSEAAAGFLKRHL